MLSCESPIYPGFCMFGRYKLMTRACNKSSTCHFWQGDINMLPRVFGAQMELKHCCSCLVWCSAWIEQIDCTQELLLCGHAECIPCPNWIFMRFIFLILSNTRAGLLAGGGLAYGTLDPCVSLSLNDVGGVFYRLRCFFFFSFC